MSTSRAPLGRVSGIERFQSRLLPAILAAFVLVSRILCRGPLYYGDGPAEIQSIVTKVYVIQPPGYWLFNRFAGLFSDPVQAIQWMNILFSVVGVVFFYYTACLFASRLNAFLAALAYSTVFYLWFSGEVHSTYASQILFPVATFYFLLRYERERARWMLGLAALAFSIGAGMRSTDGLFLVPLVVYVAGFRLPRKDALLLFGLITFFCMGWIIGTWDAVRHDEGGLQAFVTYVSFITHRQSVLHKVSGYTLANVVRYSLPLLAAFWPIVVPVVRNVRTNWGDWRVKALLIWIVPGSLFFVLVLISNAPYLNFLTAAIVLLAVAAPRWLAVTAVWNAALFLAMSPVPSQNVAVNVVNSYVLRCTRGGIEQRFNATLSEMQNWQDTR